ncbi:proteoglycan 4-like [Ctenocephalides felis]|uniref:proteoglycan 4-like n=1 Tax=Ctenocephalides felis TaxID=7515 RepID=UPI000E6E4E9F|nr:proteoglycan 4-like [Ctenocephalides felis]
MARKHEVEVGKRKCIKEKETGLDSVCKKIASYMMSSKGFTVTEQEPTTPGRYVMKPRDSSASSVPPVLKTILKKSHFSEEVSMPTTGKGAKSKTKSGKRTKKRDSDAVYKLSDRTPKIKLAKKRVTTRKVNTKNKKHVQISASDLKEVSVVLHRLPEDVVAKYRAKLENGSKNAGDVKAPNKRTRGAKRKMPAKKQPNVKTGKGSQNFDKPSPAIKRPKIETVTKSQDDEKYNLVETSQDYPVAIENPPPEYALADRSSTLEPMNSLTRPSGIEVQSYLEMPTSVAVQQVQPRERDEFDSIAEEAFQLCSAFNSEIDAEVEDDSITNSDADVQNKIDSDVEEDSLANSDVDIQEIEHDNEEDSLTNSYDEILIEIDSNVEEDSLEKSDAMMQESVTDEESQNSHITNNEPSPCTSTQEMPEIDEGTCENQIKYLNGPLYDDESQNLPSTSEEPSPCTSKHEMPEIDQGTCEKRDQIFECDDQPKNADQAATMSSTESVNDDESQSSHITNNEPSPCTSIHEMPEINQGTCEKRDQILASDDQPKNVDQAATMSSSTESVNDDESQNSHITNNEPSPCTSIHEMPEINQETCEKLDQIFECDDQPKNADQAATMSSSTEPVNDDQSQNLPSTSKEPSPCTSKHEMPEIGQETCQKRNKEPVSDDHSQNLPSTSKEPSPCTSKHKMPEIDQGMCEKRNQEPVNDDQFQNLPSTSKEPSPSTSNTKCLRLTKNV